MVTSTADLANFVQNLSQQQTARACKQILTGAERFLVDNREAGDRLAKVARQPQKAAEESSLLANAKRFLSFCLGEASGISEKEELRRRTELLALLQETADTGFQASDKLEITNFEAEFHKGSSRYVGVFTVKFGEHEYSISYSVEPDMPDGLAVLQSPRVTIKQGDELIAELSDHATHQHEIVSVHNAFKSQDLSKLKDWHYFNDATLYAGRS